MSYRKLIFIIILIFILILSFITIQNISYNYISKYFYHKNYYEFVKKYIPKLNHLRVTLDETVCDSFEKPDCYIFTKVPSVKKYKNTIVVNGDSWAEVFVKSDNFLKLFSTFSENQKVDFVLSGVTSYSFSPMISQLDVMNQDWNITPNYLVSIFDQTDVGDEICRYKNYRDRDKSGKIIVKNFDIDLLKDPYNYSFFLERNEIFFSDKSKLEKLVRISISKIKHLIAAYNKETKCSYEKIQKYMIEGLDENENIYMESIINDYVNEVFKNKNLKKLFIVTHPHKQHLLGVYRYDIGKLIKNTLINSPYFSKIVFVDFYKDNILDISDFDKNDVASHIDHNSLKKYISYILDKVEYELQNN